MVVEGGLVHPEEDRQGDHRVPDGEVQAIVATAAIAIGAGVVTVVDGGDEGISYQTTRAKVLLEANCTFSGDLALSSDGKTSSSIAFRSSGILYEQSGWVVHSSVHRNSGYHVFMDRVQHRSRPRRQMISSMPNV